jgi:predicted dehydrogenase
MGCGSVADYGHVPAILETPGLELVALFDPSKPKVDAMAQKFGVAHAFTDQDKFFDVGLDAVVVTSSATAHPANVLGAAKRGLHVLCEKPLALSDSDAESMIAAMELAKKMLLVGFVYRFSPVATQIKDWVREGVVGEIKSLRLIYVWDLHGQYVEVGGKWMESPIWAGRMLEGGPMIDCGVHMIDLARWWLGKEIVRTSQAGAWVADYVAPDHMFLHLDHEGGVHTSIEMSFTYGHTARFPRDLFSYDLIGTGGVIRYDRDGWRLEARNATEVVVGQGASEKNFPGMHRAFEEVLASGDPGDFPTGRDGLIATQIARRATDEVVAQRLPIRALEPT